MRISFWSDDASKKLEGTNKNAARLWKISNLLGKLSLGLILGVILLIIAASSQFMVESFYGLSVGEPHPGMDSNVGMAGALNQISDGLRAVLPIIALLLFVVSGLSFALYLPLVAAIAFMFEDALFGVFILGGFLFTPFALLAPYYKNKKENELLSEKEKNEKPDSKNNPEPQ